MEDDNCVVAVKEAEDGGPDVEEGDSWPRVVDGGCAACDGKDVVSAWLDDVVHADHVRSGTEAKDAVEEVATLALGGGERDGRVACVEGTSEAFHDTGDGADETERLC